MPVHDWTRVDSGTFHGFHSAWNTHLMETLNQGLLPPDYYALPEQVATRMQTDVLTLHAAGSAGAKASPAGLALAEASPPVRLRTRPTPGAKPPPTIRRGRRLVVRHISGDRVVAVIEVVSPANKDRRDSVRDLADKAEQLLRAGIHVLLIDLLPPGRHDPTGLHGAVWARFDPAGYQLPADEPFTLASYRWDDGEPEAFVEPVALGRPLIDMPLFLSGERYVSVPLERTYQETFLRFPARWRDVLEATAIAAN